MQPRLRQHDFTVEKMAVLLSSSAMKGLLVVRDELAGLIFGVKTTIAPGANFYLKGMTATLIASSAKNTKSRSISRATSMRSMGEPSPTSSRC
jgi:hypothetical protein